MSINPSNPMSTWASDDRSGADRNIESIIRRIGATAGLWSPLSTAAAGWFGGLEYQRRNGVVYLRGNFTNTGGAAGVTLVTLPAGMRPGTNMVFTSFQILSTGEVQPRAAADLSVSGNTFVQEL